MTKTIHTTIIGLIVIFIIISLVKTLLGYGEKFTYYQEREKNYMAEKKRNNKLKGDIIKAQDQQTVEEQIRNKLNRTKTHEILVILPEKTPTPTPSPTTAVPPSIQWLQLFKIN